MNNTEWIISTIEECLDRNAIRSTSKCQTKEYKSTGIYPIIDQGQEFISGWTDDPIGVVADSLPVIIFGDHTRIFKFVDFPFVRGADGTQLLKPRQGIDPLFFFYACKAIDIPNRGYNRHFSILKKKTLALPPQCEQNKIARSLSKIEDCIELQKSQLKRTQTLKYATMQTLFTQGLRGERQKETELGLVPESWSILSIKDLGQIITGTTPPTHQRENYDNGYIPFISPGDIEHGSKIEKSEKHLTQVGLAASRPLPRLTTCFVCIGSTIGKIGLTTDSVTATNQQINAIVPSQKYPPLYIFYLLTWWSSYIRSQASPSPVPILSKGAFEAIRIYSTFNLEEQLKTVQILEIIDNKIYLHRKKLSVLEDLFKTLLCKLITGEVRVSELDLSMLERSVNTVGAPV